MTAVVLGVAHKISLVGKEAVRNTSCRMAIHPLVGDQDDFDLVVSIASGVVEKRSLKCSLARKCMRICG